MTADCIFCRIAAGSVPSQKVYEDGDAFAFLDVRPLAKGHTLVIPKTHAAGFSDLAPEAASALWRAVHRVVPAVMAATGSPAATLAINDGKEAGQEVPHVHVHVVPRRAGDGAGPIHALFARRPTMEAPELAEVARGIVDALGTSARAARS